MKIINHTVSEKDDGKEIKKYAYAVICYDKTS